MGGEKIESEERRERRSRCGGEGKRSVCRYDGRRGKRRARLRNERRYERLLQLQPLQRIEGITHTRERYVIEEEENNRGRTKKGENCIE